MVDEEFCRLFFLQAGATLRTSGPPVADQGAHAGATASNHLLCLDTLDHVQRVLVNYFTPCRLLVSCSASTGLRTAPRTGWAGSPPDTAGTPRARCSGRRAGTPPPPPRRRAVCRSRSWRSGTGTRHRGEKNTPVHLTHSGRGSRAGPYCKLEDTCASYMAPEDSRVLHWKSAQGTEQLLSSRNLPASNNCVLQC